MTLINPIPRDAAYNLSTIGLECFATYVTALLRSTRQVAMLLLLAATINNLIPAPFPIFIIAV
jgi:hypothetical protein